MEQIKGVLDAKSSIPKEVSCPVCNSKFKTSKVRLSQCRVERRDEDFCTYYEGENPLFIMFGYVLNADILH